MTDGALIFPGVSFLEFCGALVLTAAVLITSIGKWHRRGAVRSTAEWTVLRFGGNPRERGTRVVTAMLDLSITLVVVVVFLVWTENFFG
jgi:hypothetical protein